MLILTGIFATLIGIILLVVAILSGISGFFVAQNASTSIHEILATLNFLIATIAFSGFANMIQSDYSSSRIVSDLKKQMAKNDKKQEQKKESPKDDEIEIDNFQHEFLNKGIYKK